MKKTSIVMSFVLMLAGCKVTTIEQADMNRIQAESSAHDPGLSRYAYPWMYVGSDQEFDYILHSGVIGDQDLYRIEKGKLKLERRFERTKEKSKWVPINQDGSTFHEKPINLWNPY
jgi:hypothetical protein